MTKTTRRAIVLGLGATPFLSSNRIGTVLAASGIWGSPPPPPDTAHTGMLDLRAWASAEAASLPLDKAACAAFAKRKVLTAYTHPAQSKAARELFAGQVAELLGLQLQSVLAQPGPGGVGYGFFFTDAYKTAWGAGTSIRFDVVCPQRLGGNASNWLYLTTTNRSTLGVEAFVSYYAQGEATFVVFDWALTSSNPWRLSVPLSALQAYLVADANTNAHRTLSIWNSTYNIGGRFYRNEVLLYNHLRGGWDLFYQYDYAADDAQQKSGGGWGPIIETFQSVYSGTAPIGFQKTLLAQSDNYGQWTDWSLLKPSQSAVRNDNNGFEIRYVAPNFAFVATS